MNLRNLLLLSFFFFPCYSLGQSIDPSLISKLSPDQLELLRDTVSAEVVTEEDEDMKVLTETLVDSESIEDSDSVEDSAEITLKKFGYDFFSKMPTSLAATGDLPLPNDYKISLRDQLRIILSGSKDSIFDLSVRLDGTILFPEIGSITVVNLSFKEVKDKLSRIISESYIGVNIDIALKDLSAKKITIVGAVNTPGTYLVNPFSTITSALAYSGGVSEIGSLRDIKLIRASGETHTFDLYELLIRGSRENDLNVQAGDTILIGAANQFLTVDGEVNRPGIYEIIDDETIEDAIGFSLGFTQTANQSNISISVLDLENSSLTKKTISNLDHSLENVQDLTVFNYVTREISNVGVFGAIKEPGFYSLDNFSSLSDLIEEIEFIDVYPWLAVLEQFDENELVKSSVLFSLNDPATYSSIELLPNSRIFFANVDELKFDVGEAAADRIDDYSLTINHSGDIIKLPVYGRYSVSSFVDYLGLDMTDVNDMASYVSPLENLVVNKNYKNMEFIAAKYNTVSFRSAENDLINVSIIGAVEYPGSYTLNDNSTIADLYKLIGSFKNQAYLEGIILTRDSIRERQLKAIQKSKEDLNKALLSSRQKGDDAIDIDIIMALSETIEPENLGRLAGNFSPKSKASIDTILFDGDTIVVPKNPNSISVLGEVLNPVSFEYSRGLTVRSAIEQAGGFQEYADKKKVYVIRANGIIEKPRRNVFVAGNSGLLPGDTIVVPRKMITDNPALQALAPITQVLSDLAFSAAALDNLSNNN